MIPDMDVVTELGFSSAVAESCELPASAFQASASFGAMIVALLAVAFLCHLVGKPYNPALGGPIALLAAVGMWQSLTSKWLSNIYHSHRYTILIIFGQRIAQPRFKFKASYRSFPTISSCWLF